MECSQQRVGWEQEYQAYASAAGGGTMESVKIISIGALERDE
jgi:hypothetical protein